MYGGTNWGNLGYDSGYTSYDYAAVCPSLYATYTVSNSN
jgi:hypothetical protein